MPSMKPADAARILSAMDHVAISRDGLYRPHGAFTSIAMSVLRHEASLSGEFTADQLRAIAAWMDDPVAVTAAADQQGKA